MTAIDTANTIGRYVIIYPSEFMNDPAGRKSMSFSQIQVFDMNGNNIALGKQVTATSRKSGSGRIKLKKIKRNCFNYKKKNIFA